MKNSLSGWTPQLTRRLKELSTPMQDSFHHWWMGYLKNRRRFQARSHQAFRLLAYVVSHQLSTWTVLHQVTTCENGCESYEHQCGEQKHKCSVDCWREKRLIVDTWRIKHCWTEDDVTWRTQLIQPTESEHSAREITHLPPAPWCETCVLGRGIETTHVRLTPS